MTTVTVLAAAHGVSAAQDVSVGHVLLQMVLALGVIVGGIWGLGKIMRRGPGKRRATGGRAAADGLTVLSRQMIGKGKSIAVVQAGEQCFLVGISDAGLTPLGELTKSGGAPVPAAARATGVPAAGGTAPLALAPPAPFDLDGVDLRVLAGSAMGPAAGAGAEPGVTVGAGSSGPGLPSMRSWLDNLREATVRR